MRSSVDAISLGEKIRDARRRADMSQESLARLAGIDRTAVNKIESGTRRVAALELADIAAALRVRMSTFFEDPTPAVVSHRSGQGLATADSQIDALLANLASEVEFVASLAAGALDLSGAEAVLQAGFKPPSNEGEADRMAEAARQLMGHSDGEALPRLTESAGRLGLLAFSRDIGPDTADGGTVLLRLGGVSLINSHMKVGRRRLALAHELGHYLIADDYTVDWRVSDRTDAASALESRLDRFARSLLLPAQAVGEKWSEWDSRSGWRTAAILLASEFRVDMSTLARRLRELDLADGEIINAVRHLRTSRTDIVELDLYVPLEELEATTVPTVFARAVVHLVREERISRERALDLLQGTFDEADLPQVRIRHADEIWKFVS